MRESDEGDGLRESLVRSVREKESVMKEMGRERERVL